MSSLKGTVLIALAMMLLSGLLLVTVQDGFAHGKGGFQCRCMEQAGAHQGCESRQSEKGCGQGKHAGHSAKKGMHSRHGQGEAQVGKGCGMGRHKGKGHGGGKKGHAGMGCGMGKHSGAGCRMMPKEIATADIQNPSAPGASQFTQACGQCHGLPDPAQHQADDWRSVVERMLAKMENSGMSVPDEKDRAAILGFLQTGSGSH